MARQLYSSWIWCALVLLSLAGCAVPQVFVPVAPVTRPGPDGVNAAAQYDVERSGQQLGEMQVWSRGAYRVDVQGKAQTLVQVGLSLHNTGAVPLHLDPTQLFLDDVALDGGTLYRLVPAQVDGNVPVLPSQTQTIQAYFRLPDRVGPEDVIEYRVAWQVRVQEPEPAGTYGNRTAFRNASYRWPYTYYAEYPWGYYPWGYYAWPYPYPGSFPYPGYAYPGYGYPLYYGPSYYGPRYGGPGGGGVRFYPRPATSRELAAPRAR